MVLTAASGLMIGRFLVWFQLFGDTADASDYEAAAGAYAASAVVLLLGAAAVRILGGPLWQLVLASVSSVVLVVLTGYALVESTAAEAGSSYVSWTDGAGGALACPWTWPLVVLGGYALVLRLRGRDREAATTGAA